MKIYQPELLKFPFEFGEEKDLLSFPLAPMICARHYIDANGNDCIFTRIVVLIPESGSDPMISEITLPNGQINIVVSFTGDGETHHTSYKAVNLSCSVKQEADYQCQTVRVVLQNDDPKTSRGTVTVVQHGNL